MICDVCSIKEATVHLTEVVNDKVTKLHLCEVCAKTKGEEMQSHFGLTDLIASLMDFGPPLGQAAAGESSLNCTKCAMTYYDFQKHGKLGCEKCYESFKQDLSNLLRKIHGSDKHVGKMPFMGKVAAKEQEALKRLKDDMSSLINNEEFEKAAIVRDRIKAVEGNIKKDDNAKPSKEKK